MTRRRPRSVTVTEKPKLMRTKLEHIKHLASQFVSNNGNGYKAKKQRSNLTRMLQRGIIASVESGMDIIDACQLAGVSRSAYLTWIEWGNKEFIRIEKLLGPAINKLVRQGELDPSDSVQMEKFVDVFVRTQAPSKYYDFLVATETAITAFHAKHLKNIGKLACGSKYLSEEFDITDTGGNVTGKKKRHRHSKPDWKASAWLLEKKFPIVYGPKVGYEGVVNHQHKHTVEPIELDKSTGHIAGVLAILLGSGAVTKQIKDCNPREPAIGEFIESETH